MCIGKAAKCLKDLSPMMELWLEEPVSRDEHEDYWTPERAAILTHGALEATSRPKGHGKSKKKC